MLRRRPSSFVLAGEGLLLRRCGELALARGHRIVHVCTTNPALAHWASAERIPTVARPDQLATKLQDNSFDYLCSIANLTLLPETLLRLPRHAAINFHDGPLPQYAGINAPVWALINRESSYGVTWHLMDARADAGNILKQRLFPIADDESALTLNFKCYEAGSESFDELLDDLSQGTPSGRPQDLSSRTYCARWDRPQAQGTMSWARSADDTAALVRALDFGPYPNPLGVAKLATEHEVLAIRTARVAPRSGRAPGTIVSNQAGVIRVATATDDLELTDFFRLEGRALDAAALEAHGGLQAGSVLPELTPDVAARLDQVARATAAHEGYWSARIEKMEPALPPYSRRSTHMAHAVAFVTLAASVPAESVQALSGSSGGRRADVLVAGLAGYLARVGGSQSFDIGYRDAHLADTVGPVGAWFAPYAPLRIDCDSAKPFSALLQAVSQGIADVQRRETYARDLPLRVPALVDAQAAGARPPLAVAVDLSGRPEQLSGIAGAQLVLSVAPDGSDCRWTFDPTYLTVADVGRVDEQLGVLLSAAAADATLSVGTLPLVSEREREQLLRGWARSEAPESAPATVHRAFEEQVTRSPDAVALVFHEERITYRELNEQANRLARELQRRQVQRSSLVGICVERSPRMLVALLAVLKSGAAYVPLDPRYPAARLRFMLEDAGVSVLISERHLLPALPAGRASLLLLDDAGTTGEEDTANLPDSAAGDDLAYVIYTSGSTGEPKGVMVTHGNVMNLIAGMDDRIGEAAPGVWLAVTSLSFDISVLELFWTLARGFTVVLHAGEGREAAPVAPRRAMAHAQPVEFSLFYFASDEGSDGDKYRLLMEGARFADRHGFTAVWTPERHFHAFGGLYPNPAVASAAVAAATTRIGIRAGSVVLPLHSPIRVAEEWAVVDNLSGGRVGVSFASGWHPNDFVLRPENFAESKKVMLRDIDVVRRLWRGEEIAFPGPNGSSVPVRTLPRPVQAELPVWVTSAGSPDTFRAAGQIGAGVLTHLLGQTIEELRDRLAVYREAWRAAGHPGSGHVTLMLHTFVGEDADAVREKVRAPLTEYLRSSVNLMKPFAASFPAFKRHGANGAAPDAKIDLAALSSEDMEALLGYSFERYYETSGLFGTPETCQAMVDRLGALGVDEVACLIDFGVDTDAVLDGLRYLNQLRERSARRVEAGPADYSIAGLVARHGVTHLQCTPSLVSMLLEDDAAREALTSLRTLLVGGEAFPPALAARLEGVVPGTICNMYGPTETTVWSSSHQLRRGEHTIPLGRPIRNTEFYVVDELLQPVPAGVEGELLIGGDGVAAGYLRRPELTAQRFLPHPWRPGTDARVYRTGDRVRALPDGGLEFLGRMDQQVKLGGVRIELGEIEHAIGLHPWVHEAAVVTREQEGVSRLVAYVVPAPGRAPRDTELRDFVRQRLPEAMVPTAWALLGELPRTPNGKLDRASLPAPGSARGGMQNEYVAPRDSLERELVKMWERVLDRRPIGVTDNFFELGGHSLLAVSLMTAIHGLYARRLSPVTLFRAPTIAQIAEVLREEFWSGSPTTVVPLKPEGNRAALFLVHWASGHVFSYRALASHLGADQPVYGIQAQGLLGEQEPETSIQRMAEHYIREIRAVQPHGPYHLGGSCLGGIVAFEMAQQLTDAGEPVGVVAMLHSGAPRAALSLASARIAASLVQPFLRAGVDAIRKLPPSGRMAYLLDKVRNALGTIHQRVLGGEPPGDALSRSEAGPLTVQGAAKLAEQEYQARLAAGRATVFRAENWRDSTVNPTADLGWGRWYTMGAEVHDVPGIELGILDEPHVRVLAERLQECLDRSTPAPLAQGAPTAQPASLAGV